MKNSLIPLLLIGTLSSCAGSSKLDNTSPLFQEYKSVEEEITMTMSFNKIPFLEKYRYFLEKNSWNGFLQDIPDGTYDSHSLQDSRGYIHYIRYTVEDGRLTDVYYDEFDPDNDYGKRSDKEYGERMFRAVQMSPELAYPQIEEQLLDRQNPLLIDGVSGATKSTYRCQLVMLKSIYEVRSNVILNDTLFEKGAEIYRNYMNR